MRSSLRSLRLPPGSSGWPVLGETLAFVRNPFAFIDERLAKHGPIFRSNLLFRNTVVIAGPAAPRYWTDETKVIRRGALPATLQALLAAPSLPTLDGEEHRTRKRLVMRALDRDAVPAYLPTMQRLVGSYLDSWGSLDQIRLVEESKKLALDVLFASLLGIEPGPAMNQLRIDFGTAFAGFVSLPINLPGSRLNNALKARDRILACVEEVLRQRTERPAYDGASRLLEATIDGVKLSSDEAKRELYHAVVAGFSVYVAFVAIILQLSQHHEVQAKLRQEVGRLATDEALSLGTLERLPYLNTVLMEVLRLSPVLPPVLPEGMARETFEFNGFTVPKGWGVWWASRSTHTDEATFTHVTRFDPDRFAEGREEHRRHEYAFVPFSAGPATSSHSCAGAVFAPAFMKVFTILLVRDYEWTLPKQDLTYNWRLVPPEPKDGLRITIRRRARPS